MRILGTASLTLLCLIMLGPSIVYSDVPDKTLHHKCIYPTVKIEVAVERADGAIIGSGSTGSGVIVKSIKIGGSYHNVMFTCNHVIRTSAIAAMIKLRLGGERFVPKFKIWIRVAKYKKWSVFDGYKRYIGTVYAGSTSKDIAIVMFRSDKKMHTADISFKHKLYLGTNIYKVGCGLGDQPRLDYGKITSLNPNVGMSDSIRISAPTIAGDSGGPVFHKYKLIGLAYAVRQYRNAAVFHMGYFRSVKDYKIWSKKSNNNLSFLYTDDKLPSIPFAKLKVVDDYKANRDWWPDSIWKQEIITKHKALLR